MMAATIVCPVCGETNPSDMEFCRNCQSRLRPLTGPLKAEDAPIQPGMPPTKKTTSELEPLLPQWLREAREQARQSAAEDASTAGSEEQESAPTATPDLLAGLASRASEDEEDDVPEWLANITGATSKKKKAAAEDSQVKWVELGRSEEVDVPGPRIDDHPEHSTTPPSPEKDELRDWFRQAGVSAETDEFRLGRAETAEPTTTPESPVEPSSVPPSGAGDLSWLRDLDAGTSFDAQPTSDEAPPARGEIPDWLRNLEAEQIPPAAPAPIQQPVPPAADVPDWLRQLDRDAASSPVTADELPGEEPLLFDQPLPDWLKAEKPEAIQPDEQPAHWELPGDTGVPISEPAAEHEPEATEPVSPPADAFATPAKFPDWLSTQRSQATPPPIEGEHSERGPLPEEPAMPAWISSLEEPAESAQQPSVPGTPAFKIDQPAEEPASPAPEPFTSEALPEGDAEAIFASLQTPEWLAGIAPAQPTDETAAPPVPQEQPIAPAELPTWVQAMRPVESAMAAGGSAVQEPPTEERGPLAGLHGVLPSIPGAAQPSSKPKPYSVKLDATEQQLAHAALLEQILAAETAPIPMKSSALPRSQRAIRWAISLLMMLVVTAVLLSGTRIFPLPGAVPNESIAAVQAIQSIPPDAPVLMIFDYQPSTVGEMEATSSSLVENLLLLKHPKLALLSTSPTGAALAERFMGGAMPDMPQQYERDVQYVNLGYLPGGLAGIYRFVLNPSATVPLDASSRAAWQSPILASVQSFSDFAAIIVLTDSVEAGRSWVEQTAGRRGNSQMVLISSAQAGPMLLPYVDSGQANGMISGLNGAAGAEQANAGLPGFIRRYWDAYSVGLCLAVALILVGGLWNLWLNMRSRRAEGV